MIRAQVNQSILKGGQRLPEARLRQVLAACARSLGCKKEAIVSIALISGSQMRRLNKTWRGKDKRADVLSFELDKGPLKGEILLNYEQAALQAKQMKHSVLDELCFLVIHGVLHLWGYDHENSKDAKKMFPLQEKILRSLKIDSLM